MSRSSEQCSLLMRSLLLAYCSAVGEALGETVPLPFLPISVCHFYLLLWRSGSATSWLLFRGNFSIYSCRLVSGKKGWVQDFPLPASWTSFSCTCFLFQVSDWHSMLCFPIFSPLSTASVVPLLVIWTERKVVLQNINWTFIRTDDCTSLVGEKKKF